MKCPKCDTFEVPGGVSACVECALSEAIRQRDEARLLVAAEARRADAWKAEADKRGEALEEVREAARTLLAELSDWSQCSCSYAGCLHVATRYADDWLACDEHSELLDGIGIGRRGKGRGELRFAPAMRRLRALTEVKP